MSLDLLIQVMALCHQATSHYLNQVLTQSHVVTCQLCVICVRKDVDSSVSVIITNACSLNSYAPPHVKFVQAVSNFGAQILNRFF